jgi:hypothetical protein
MFDLVDSKELEAGVYCSYTNTKGVVRDHRLSIRSGFSANVSPVLMRHPCNLQVISHAENIAKRFKGDTLTISQLIELIVKYDKPWVEQEQAVMLIERMK